MHTRPRLWALQNDVPVQPGPLHGVLADEGLARLDLERVHREHVGHSQLGALHRAGDQGLGVGLDLEFHVLEINWRY